MIKDVLFVDTSLTHADDLITNQQDSLLKMYYLGPLNRLNRDKNSLDNTPLLCPGVGFQTNLAGTACILMSGAYPPVYLCLHWIQGTFRAERACPICVRHDNNTGTIDERSCGNLLQVTTGEHSAKETE